MNSADAARVFGTLTAAFPQEAMEHATIDFWAMQLHGLDDAEAAMACVMALAKSARKFPPYADFLNGYRFHLERRQRERADDYGLPEGPRETVVPEWVCVWWWARRKRDPRIVSDIGFPQQYGFCDPTKMMNQESYDALRAEWEAVGSPRVTPGEVLAGSEPQSVTR